MTPALRQACVDHLRELAAAVELGHLDVYNTKSERSVVPENDTYKPGDELSCTFEFRYVTSAPEPDPCEASVLRPTRQLRMPLIGSDSVTEPLWLLSALRDIANVTPEPAMRDEHYTAELRDTLGCVRLILRSLENGSLRLRNWGYDHGVHTRADVSALQPRTFFFTVENP